MTTGNESDPRDDVLAKAWHAQSRDLPPPALDATILAAAHRAVGSGPRAAGKQALEATRPQRWWMPLAAAAAIGVVAIGILQIAPQAPVDIIVGERAEVAGRVAPAVPAAPALSDARKQVAAAPQTPAPEPFPAGKLSSKVDGQSATRQNGRKDAAKPQSAPVPFNEAATRSEGSPPAASARLAAPATTPSAAPAQAPMAAPAPMVALAPAPPAAPAAAMMAPPAPRVARAPAPPAAPATAMIVPEPMKKESMGAASGSVSMADSAAKHAGGARERDIARDETSARNAPAAALPELARSTTSPAELQARARDPDAWIARIRKLRTDGRSAEAVAELREFRRYVSDAESRLPADLRQWAPVP